MSLAGAPLPVPSVFSATIVFSSVAVTPPSLQMPPPPESDVEL